MSREISIASYAPNTPQEMLRKIRAMRAIRRAYRAAGTVPSNCFAVGNYNANQIPPRR